MYATVRSYKLLLTPPPQVDFPGRGEKVITVLKCTGLCHLLGFTLGLSKPSDNPIQLFGLKFTNIRLFDEYGVWQGEVKNCNLKKYCNLMKINNS